MSSRWWSRPAAVLGAIGLVGSLLLAGASSISADSNTRDIYFGSPPAPPQPPAALSVGPINIASPVVASGRTAFQLVTDNYGPQNVTHLFVYGGNAVPSGFPSDPGGTYLTPGAAFFEVVPVGYPASGQPGSPCSLTSTKWTNDGFSCDFGSLSAGSSVQLQAVVQTGSASSSLNVVAAAQLNESTNNNGTNQQTFYAAGSQGVITGSGANYSQSIFLDPNISGSVANPQAFEHTSAKADVPGVANGTPAGITTVDDSSGVFCKPNYVCIGSAATGSAAATIVGVYYGNALSPYLVVTLTWDASILPNGYNPKKGGVIHTLDDGSQVFIPNNVACTDPIQSTGCVYKYSLTKTTYTIVVRTPTNGGFRGV